MTKIVFFGTQEFAKGILESLLNDSDFEVVGVFTQPDKPVGRKQEIQMSPVKILALEKNIPIFQPESLKNYEMPNLGADLNIVCQYGLIIPQTVLDSAKHGSINIHTSLLPKYRGASPIQSAILNGEKETGTTIMLMDSKMDHGPILMQEKITIDPDDTYLTLSDKMLPTASTLLLNTIKDYLKGIVKPQEQDHDKAILCKMFTREDGKIDFNKSAQEIYNQFRGFYVWPGVFTFFGDKRVKLLNIKPVEKKSEPGKFITENGRLFIGCADGAIEIFKLQPEGKNPMTAEAFVNGYIK
ncbi:MAG TPA: methionyl-tRNA formyltransferase [Candidatus Magasanikbacteria bacterium]|nr:methionyl-tRNA formyltransferase [Candidatus Magasanikbacteria bacterium]